MSDGADGLLHVLQFAISPAVLVTAVGLLLGPATTRLGRAIDRCRSLGRELDDSQGQLPGKLEQLRIVHERAHTLRRCITCYGASLFLSCLIVLLLFVRVLLGWKLEAAVVAVFGLDVLCLMAGAAFFLQDLVVALRALDIEVAPHLN
jgi:hypothetical protein